MSKYFPWEYTEKEGGTFYQWVYGEISTRQLRKALLTRDKSCNMVTINGHLVHSLIFESSSAGFGSYARWDCINGWTKTIKHVKKQ